MLVVWVLVNHDLVPGIVHVCNAFCVFTLVVLEDKLLLTFLDVLPVSLERCVEDGVAIENQLRWCSSGRSVHC